MASWFGKPVSPVVLMAYLVVVGGRNVSRRVAHLFSLSFPGRLETSRTGLRGRWFQAADGTRLHGWYVPPPHARAAVLFCHGNGGNITHRADALQLLHQRSGVSVLIFDYRGYGRSEGKPSEAGVLADARAARAWLAAREKIPDADRADGRVAGRRRGRRSGRPRRHPGPGAGKHLQFVARRGRVSLSLAAGPLADAHAIRLGRQDRRLSRPAVESHGDADTIVPLRFGRRLFDAANQPKQFFLLPGHDHNDRCRWSTTTPWGSF